MMLIGIAGSAGSGKSTIGDILAEQHGFTCVALADVMKRFAAELFGWDEETLWGPSEKRNAPDPRYVRNLREAHVPVAKDGTNETVCLECGKRGAPIPEGVCGVELTPRHALQFLGTEVGRSLYRDVWIEYALRIAQRLAMSGVARGVNYSYTRAGGLVCTGLPQGPRCRGVAITDVRFANELGAIRAMGYVVRVTRPGAGLVGAAAAHASEAEQLAIPDNLFDGVLVNDTTIADLEKVVSDMVASFEANRKRVA